MVARKPRPAEVFAYKLMRALERVEAGGCKALDPERALTDAPGQPVRSAPSVSPLLADCWFLRWAERLLLKVRFRVGTKRLEMWGFVYLKGRTHQSLAERYKVTRSAITHAVAEVNGWIETELAAARG